MGSSFKGQRCGDCSGALEFDKVLMHWFCPYCGKIYERDLQVDKVQIDGIAGINELSRACLIDVSKCNFDSAEDGISECERANANHFATKICNVCYHLFAASNLTDKSKVQLHLAKTKQFLKQLQTDFSYVGDEERKLYDYYNTQDIYAILYITFNSLGLQEREQLIYNYLDMGSIYDQKINKSLISIAIKKHNTADLDKLIQNISFIDKRSALNDILKKYPDDETKVRYIDFLFSQEAFTQKDYFLVNNYFKDTSDSALTKLFVFAKCSELKMNVDVTDMIKNIFSGNLSQKEIKKVFELLEKIKLSKENAQIIFKYCLFGDSVSEKVAINGLEYLRNSGGIFEVSSSEVIEYIEKSNQFSHELFQTLINKFNINNKSLDTLVTYGLLKLDKPKKIRKDIIEKIITKAKTITIKTLEDYTLLVSKDCEFKAEILKLILDCGINPNYYNNLLSKYMNTKIDTFDIKVEIVNLLLDKKLKYTSKDLSIFILSVAEHVDEKFINKFKANSVSPLATTLDSYIISLSDVKKYNSVLVDYLVSYPVSSSKQTVEKFLLKFENVPKRLPIALAILNGTSKENYDSNILFSYNNSSIYGNIAQAYLLSSKDDIYVKTKILDELVKLAKLNAEIKVNNREIKFKKYIIENKNNLDQDINSLCESLGVYKLFF